MSNPPSDKNPTPAGRHPVPHDSRASIETFPLRKKKPGQVGLANAARPGLGTRPTGPDERTARIVDVDAMSDAVRPGAVPHPPEPRHDPEEQDSGSLAQEWQRDTGVSGHSGGT